MKNYNWEQELKRKIELCGGHIGQLSSNLLQP